MSDCPHYYLGQCKIASGLATLEVLTNPDACNHCTYKESNPRDKNYVTASLALSAALKAGIKDPQVIEKVKSYLPQVTTLIVTYGPGTELEKLISWFKKKNTKCNCQDRINKMNQWGPDKCVENMDIILGWLHKSATKYRIPFIRPVVKKLVERAIYNARLKMGSSSHDSTS